MSQSCLCFKCVTKDLKFRNPEPSWSGAAEFPVFDLGKRFASTAVVIAELNGELPAPSV